MKSVFRILPCFVLATAVLVSWNSPARSGPDPGEAPPARDRPQERDVHRLEEMIIQGNADVPGVLYLLPRVESPPLPLTAGPAERKESILLDTRDVDDAFLSDGSWATRSDQK